MKVKGTDHRLTEYRKGMVWRPRVGQIVRVIHTCCATTLIGKEGEVTHIEPPVVTINDKPYCLLSKEIEPTGTAKEVVEVDLRKPWVCAGCGHSMLQATQPTRCLKCGVRLKE